MNISTKNIFNWQCINIDKGKTNDTPCRCKAYICTINTKDMAKKEYISRFLMIVKRIKKGNYPSYEILSDYIQRETEYLDDDFYIGFSKRTLQRDKRT